MAKYICEKCLVNFKQKNYYNRHIARKNICSNAKKILTRTMKNEKDYENYINNIMSNKKAKYVDLFCGMGSFHYSFKKLGMECVMACDINSDVQKVYEKNWGIKPMGDIKKIDPSTIPDYDILCAGFPCQPFSNAGKQKGFKDKHKGDLFYDVMRFACINKPKVLLLENVSGLLNHDNGNTMKTIVKEITNLGYKVSYKILKCSDYGIPQMRKRLFIVAVKDPSFIMDDIFDLSMYEKSVTLTEYMGKQFDKEIAYTIRCGGRRSPINDKHNWDGYIVNKDEYRLTISDCLKLQGFDNFTFGECSETEQWRMLGNTIPTVFTTILGETLNDFIFNIKFGDYFVSINMELLQQFHKKKALQKLFDKYPEIDEDKLLTIYDECISIRQSSVCVTGKDLENIIETFLKNNNIKYRTQVPIDINGIVQNIRNKNTNSIIDIVLGDPQKGDSIKKMIVLSCKSSCRERWKQDNWTLGTPPYKYYLLTTSSDYPLMPFKESESRKIITSRAKKNDTRKYKLSFDDLLEELQKYNT